MDAQLDWQSFEPNRQLSQKIKLPVALAVDQWLSAGLHIGISWAPIEVLTKSEDLGGRAQTSGVPMHGSIENRGCVTMSCCHAG